MDSFDLMCLEMSFCYFPFIDEDEPLFMSLVADLFPSQTLEKTAYPELEEKIAREVEEAGLIYHTPWVLKLIQVDNISLYLYILPKNLYKNLNASVHLDFSSTKLRGCDME